VKPRAVLAYCREKGIRFVDLRFPDGRGRSRRLTVPVNVLTEASFEQGFGVSAWKSGRHLVAIPTPVQTYIDPTDGLSTLILYCTLSDGQTGEPTLFDPRELVKRAVEAVRSVGLADGVSVKLSAPFHYLDEREQPLGKQPLGSSVDRWLADGLLDRHSGIRSELAELCVESGVGLERHFFGEVGVSELQLVAKPLLNACDDLMVFRSLLEKHSLSKNLTLHPSTIYTNSHWVLTKNSDPIIGGVHEFALSELAWHAAGGVIKHRMALAAIARASTHRMQEENSGVAPLELGEGLERCIGALTEADARSAVSVHYASLAPRQRALRVAGLPSNGCPYILLSAILLAMIDGILNKVVPANLSTDNEGKERTTANPSNGFVTAKSLEEDSDFLAFSEVFPDPLVQALISNLPQ